MLTTIYFLLTSSTVREMSLEEKLANLPAQPGCYLYRDKKNQIIYVGKAKNLRNRIRHYFQATADVRLHELVSRIAQMLNSSLLTMKSKRSRLNAT